MVGQHAGKVVEFNEKHDFQVPHSSRTRTEPAVRFVLTCDNTSESNTDSLWMKLDQYSKFKARLDNQRAKAQASGEIVEVKTDASADVVDVTQSEDRSNTIRQFFTETGRTYVTCSAIKDGQETGLNPGKYWKCMLCHKEYKQAGKSTCYLAKHLRLQHPEQHLSA